MLLYFKASCKTIGYTTDEHSLTSNIDLEKKMLQQQLENERNKARSLEIKLRQIQVRQTAQNPYKLFA